MKLLPFALAAILLWSSPLASAPAAEAPSSWTNEWKRTDFSRASVDFDEIRSGGPSKDGIPAIDHPKYGAPGEVDNIGDQEPVITVTLNGEIRAYPVRILIWHEIANDVLGGVPVSITYCPLCNSAIVFDRNINDLVLTFGTSGMLRNSDFIMWDRQTETWWQQLTGEGIIGQLAGHKLTFIPAQIISWEDFKAANPKGQGYPGIRVWAVATVKIPTPDTTG